MVYLNMKIEEVKRCSFEKWYKEFSKVTIKSIILPLPDGFVSYILTDGIVLPKSSKAQLIVQNDDSDSEEEVINWEDSEDTIELEAPQFLDFDKSISDAIESLGGKVFPKLNWSSPKDASWIAFNNSCCCTSVSDVYLLLKSSDFIIHDLTQSFIQCEDFCDESIDSVSTQEVETFYLVLRKWREIDTSGEFRCFVRNNELIGISQREHSIFFEHICQYKEDIIEDIVLFFKQHINLKFSSCDYVFDVYRRIKGKVCLIDFNPFGVVTDSLLFSWDELNSESLKINEKGLPEFRFVHDNYGVQPRPLGYHAVPRDIVDLSTGEDSFKLVDLLKLKIDEQNAASSGEEES